MLPRDVLLSRGDNVGTTFGGHCLLKIWEGKNVWNFVQFWTTSDFDHEHYLKRSKISTGSPAMLGKADCTTYV